ncbi:hypothetical protein [Mangrovicoccus ximenensis]|uniref:hypothetical protein n=1 Tax=Mangrovicoccus ximenensis TaxID=1911570 RepID=UPI0011AE68DB|nr:hypothetical protein [Mangrovicoccus ximenensis]
MRTVLPGASCAAARPSGPKAAAEIPSAVALARNSAAFARVFQRIARRRRRCLGGIRARALLCQGIRRFRQPLLYRSQGRLEPPGQSVQIAHVPVL